MTMVQNNVLIIQFVSHRNDKNDYSIIKTKNDNGSKQCANNTICTTCRQFTSEYPHFSFNHYTNH